MSDSDFDTDPALLDRIRGGDVDALAELFSEYRSRLWRVVNFRLDARLIGRADPEDILQEAWLNAAKRISAFPTDPELSTFIWFRLIVNQTLIEVHRRHLGAKKRSAGREIRGSSGYDPNTTTFSLSSHLLGRLTSPSEAAIRDERARHLRAALEQMNEVDREVLALRHFEELSNRETAEVLGISEQAASVRYVRALKRLQKIVSAVPGMV
ncbi:sigma-70 family RNA polymerase sigma factor [Stratiformator vulcanicus]|uniref:ECF RNA polymerase sigma factor SigW n=1 Tax=Stratiformator vulcanicus TaxID=2527980 RepID=A0A517R607_9PLAN|nr:sigma-70 family RNA polymerase sigma factor [Stratiformator vulcanicus]QDT39263.1 ECF RNA polymerase sigma factor SigW [Stratiformator vulcanicus]